MKKLLVLCLAIGVAVLAAIPAEADCRRVVQRRAVVVETPVVVTPIVATTFLAVPVPVYPVYGVGYGQSDVQGLRDEIAQLRRMIAAPHQAAPCPPGPVVPIPPVVNPPMPPATGLVPAKYQSPKLLAMFSRACASCHDGSGARDAGKKLAFLTDDKKSVADQPDGIRNLSYRLVSNGNMPKGGAPVSDDELAEVDHYAAGK